MTLGRQVYFNFNCVVLDVCRVRIGSHTMFGPAVQIYTPMHPMNAIERRGKEYGKLVQKLLALALLDADAQELYERSVQGIDRAVARLVSARRRSGPSLSRQAVGS